MGRILHVLLFTAFIVSVPSQPAFLIEDPGTYPYTMAARRQAATVRLAMRYHGTTGAFGDGQRWFFRREGTTCRLFTPACRRTLAKALTGRQSVNASRQENGHGDDLLGHSGARMAG